MYMIFAKEMMEKVQEEITLIYIGQDLEEGAGQTQDY